MKVIIAEKPSVAQGIASVVGARQRKEGYLTGDGYAVTWAFGHLVGLAMPESYGFSGFRREHLPILPQEFRLVPRQVREGKVYKDDPGVVRQLEVLRELFDRCESIIVATDAGREGELIFRYVYNYLGCTKPFVRLWISSLTDKAIREGLRNLREGSLYDNLYLSAKARSEADWLVGINSSQALSLAAGQGVFSLGRVQTPTLAMICSRYRENKQFVPRKYFQIKVSAAKDGIAFSALSRNRFDDLETATAGLREVEDGGMLAVSSVERREAVQEPPLLYDLTALQKEANGKLDFSADKTLTLAQSLYEKKVLSYPRTGSRYISEDVFEEIPSRITLLQQYPRFGGLLAAGGDKRLVIRQIGMRLTQEGQQGKTVVRQFIRFFRYGYRHVGFILIHIIIGLLSDTIPDGLSLPAAFFSLRFPVREGIAYGKIGIKHQCGIEAPALTVPEAFDKRGAACGHQPDNQFVGQHLASLVAEQGESAIDIGAFGDLVEEQDAALLAFGTGALLP
jgi:DNA topoisomerase III